jgi:hypothetical protein
MHATHARNSCAQRIIVRDRLSRGMRPFAGNHFADRCRQEAIQPALIAERSQLPSRPNKIEQVDFAKRGTLCKTKLLVVVQLCIQKRNANMLLITNDLLFHRCVMVLNFGESAALGYEILYCPGLRIQLNTLTQAPAVEALDEVH